MKYLKNLLVWSYRRKYSWLSGILGGDAADIVRDAATVIFIKEMQKEVSIQELSDAQRIFTRRFCGPSRESTD